MPRFALFTTAALLSWAALGVSAGAQGACVPTSACPSGSAAVSLQIGELRFLQLAQPNVPPAFVFGPEDFVAANGTFTAVEREVAGGTLSFASNVGGSVQVGLSSSLPTFVETLRLRLSDAPSAPVTLNRAGATVLRTINATGTGSARTLALTWLATPNIARLPAGQNSDLQNVVVTFTFTP